MNVDVTRWIKKTCAHYGIQAFFLDKHGGTYVLHRKGAAIQNFTAAQFYEINPVERFKMIRPLLKVGLHTNLSNPNRDSIFGRFQNGIPIVK